MPPPSFSSIKVFSATGLLRASLVQPVKVIVTSLPAKEAAIRPVFEAPTFPAAVLSFQKTPSLSEAREPPITDRSAAACV